MKLGATLYVNDSIDALNLYQKAFGLTLGFHVKSDDGSYFHAELMRGEEILFAISGEHDKNKDISNHLESLSFYQHVIQLAIDLGNEEAVKMAFDILSDGGRVESQPSPCDWNPCIASVIDKNNVWWYLSV